MRKDESSLSVANNLLGNAPHTSRGNRAAPHSGSSTNPLRIPQSAGQCPESCITGSILRVGMSFALGNGWRPSPCTAKEVLP